MDRKSLNVTATDWAGMSPSVASQWTLLPDGDFTVDGWFRVTATNETNVTRLFVDGVEIDPNAWTQLELPLEGN